MPSTLAHRRCHRLDLLQSPGSVALRYVTRKPNVFSTVILMILTLLFCAVVVVSLTFHSILSLWFVSFFRRPNQGTDAANHGTVATSARVHIRKPLDRVGGSVPEPTDEVKRRLAYPVICSIVYRLHWQAVYSQPRPVIGNFSFFFSTADVMRYGKGCVKTFPSATRTPTPH